MNTTSQAVTVVVIFGVVLFAGIWALGASADDAGEEIVVEETVEQSTTEQELETTAVNWGEPLVEVDGTELDESEYEFDSVEGTIVFEEDTGANATVTVDATEVDENTQSFLVIFEPLLNIGGLLPLVLAVGAVFFGLQSLSNNGRGGAY